MKSIAFYNNKGGVGKSTMSVSVAHALSVLGLKVLLIDTDGQNHTKLMLDIDIKEDQKTLIDFLRREDPASLEEVIIKEVRTNLDVIANEDISAINDMLAEEKRLDLLLAKKFKSIEDYDVMIFDCSPSESKINDTVLIYVDSIIVPLQCENASIEGVTGLYKYLDKLYVEADKIRCVIPTMFMNTGTQKRHLDMIHNLFKDTDAIITEKINRRTKIAECVEFRKTPLEFDKDAATEIMKAAKEVVKLINE